MLMSHIGDCVFFIPSAQVCLSSHSDKVFLRKLWSTKARLQLAAVVKRGVSHVSVEPTSHTMCTNLCNSGDNKWHSSEISGHIFHYVLWINHQQHLLHLRVVNATDRKFSVNSILEILPISVLFINKS